MDNTPRGTREPPSWQWSPGNPVPPPNRPEALPGRQDDHRTQTNTHGTPADRKARPPHTFLSHAQIGPGLPNHEICQQPKNQCTERSIHQSKKPGSPQERQFTSCSKDQPTRDHKSGSGPQARRTNVDLQPGLSGSRPTLMQCANTPAIDQDHGELSPPTRSSVSCQKIFSNCSERTKEKGSTSQTSHTYR